MKPRLFDGLLVALGCSLAINTQIKTGFSQGFGSWVTVTAMLMAIYYLANPGARARAVSSIEWPPLLAALSVLFYGTFLTSSFDSGWPAIRTSIFAIFSGVVLLVSLTRQRDRLVLILSYVLSSMVMSVLLAHSWITGGAARAALDPERFSAMNETGIMVGVAILLVGGALFSWAPRYLRVIALLVLFIGLIASGSRGALLGLVLGGALQALLVSAQDRRVLALGIASTLGAVVLIVLSQGTQPFERYLMLASGVGDVSGRSGIWEAALKVDPDVMVFGNGLGGSAETLSPMMGRPRSTHNLLIELVLEVGFLGLAILAFLFFRGAALARKPLGVGRIYYPVVLHIAVATVSLHFFVSPLFWVLVLLSVSRPIRRAHEIAKARLSPL